ncbi:uncharacterized protein ACO6RY_11135 [Pungitius sinensis]
MLKPPSASSPSLLSLCECFSSFLLCAHGFFCVSSPPVTSKSLRASGSRSTVSSLNCSGVKNRSISDEMNGSKTHKEIPPHGRTVFSELCGPRRPDPKRIVGSSDVSLLP